MSDERTLTPDELDELVVHIKEKYDTAMNVLAGNITPKEAEKLDEPSKSE